MKKYILSIAIASLFVIYIVFGRKQSTAIISTPTSAGQNSMTGNTTGSSEAIAAIQYKNGTYAGDVADAFYGNVQVQITVNEGKITDVAFLQYPSDRNESQQISNRSMPRLITEAISAQKSNVDIVTGATQTSEAFRQSLSSALTQAKL